MLRRFLVLIVIVGAGAAYGQVTLTGQQIAGFVKAQGTITSGPLMNVGEWPWLRLMAGQSLSFTHEGIQIHIDTVEFRIAALSAYVAMRTDDGWDGGCNAFEAGLWMCEPGGASPLRMNHRAEMFIRPVPNCGVSQEPGFHGAMGRLAGNQQWLWGGNYNVGGVQCTHDLSVAFVRAAGHVDYEIFPRFDEASAVSFVNALGGSSGGGSGDLDSSSGRDSGKTFPTYAQQQEYFRYMLEAGLDHAQPSVGELESGWGVTLVGSYADGGYGLEPFEPEDPLNPGGPDDEGPEPGGGTDWQEGQHKTRCDDSGGLNIFEKSLFYAFEPCEPWAERFLDMREGAVERFPFGITAVIGDWYQYRNLFGAWPADSGDPEESHRLADLDGSLAEFRGAPVVYLPDMTIGGVHIPAWKWDYREVRAVQLWVQYGRPLLWYWFLFFFFWGIFRRVVQT